MEDLDFHLIKSFENESAPPPQKKENRLARAVSFTRI